MARRAAAQRRQMPDRKVWPGRWWPAAKTSTSQGAGERDLSHREPAPVGARLSPVPPGLALVRLRPAPVRPGLAPVPLQQALVGRGLALVQPRLALIWLKPVFSFTNNLLISFYLNQCHRPWPSVVARPFSGAFPAPRIQVDMIATGLLHALWLVLPPSAQIATR